MALACDAGLQTLLCKTRLLVTYLFRNSVFGIAALVIATLHVIRPSIVLLTGGLIAAGVRHRALQCRPVGHRDRAAYFGICAARARHSVSAEQRNTARRSTATASCPAPR